MAQVPSFATAGISAALCCGASAHPPTALSHARFLLRLPQKGSGKLGYESEAFAIYDTMRYIKPPVVRPPVCVLPGLPPCASVLPACRRSLRVGCLCAPESDHEPAAVELESTESVGSALGEAALPSARRQCLGCHAPACSAYLACLAYLAYLACNPIRFPAVHGVRGLGIRRGRDAAGCGRAGAASGAALDLNHDPAAHAALHADAGV